MSWSRTRLHDTFGVQDSAPGDWGQGSILPFMAPPPPIGGGAFKELEHRKHLYRYRWARVFYMMMVSYRYLCP